LYTGSREEWEDSRLGKTIQSGMGVKIKELFTDKSKNPDVIETPFKMQFSENKQFKV